MPGNDFRFLIYKTYENGGDKGAEVFRENAFHGDFKRENEFSIRKEKARGRDR